MGGLPRRNHIVTTQQDAGPTVVVDAGWSLVKRAPSAAERGQVVAKAGLMAEAMMVVGLDAAAIGGADWSIGRSAVQDIVRRTKLPVLAANLECDGRPLYPASLVVERGGARIGFVGVTGGDVDGCTVSAPGAAVDLAMEALPPVDLYVVLAPFDKGRTARMLQSMRLAPDLVIDADADRRDDHAVLVRSSYVVGQGDRGRFVGVSSLSIRPGGRGLLPEGASGTIGRQIAAVDRRLAALDGRMAKARSDRAKRDLREYVATAKADRARLEEEQASVAGRSVDAHGIVTKLHSLGTDVPEHPATKRMTTRFKENQDALAPVAVATAAWVGPRGSRWAGAQACAACHPAIDEQWRSTGHARAWQALIDDRRASDHECFSCHSTGADTPGGPTTPSEVRGLRDVQCESCHGAGAKHAADPGRNHLVRSPGEATCVTCHDGDRDGGRFDYASYRPRVVHTIGGGR